MFDNFNDLVSWILSISIGLITLYLVRFYIRVFKSPNGPFPLPILGNVLLFRKTKVNQFITISELSKKYGPVFTVWFGSTPMVIISDLEIVKKVFNSKNNELMGRPDTFIKKLLTQNNGNDIVFTDHGPVWASLRRVAHSAVRKLAINDNFAYLVDDVVNETIESIKKNEGIDKAFDPKSYIYLTVYNIIASSAFGKRYSEDDKELKFFENSFELFRKNTNELAVTDRIPILKPFYYKTINKVSKVLSELSVTIRKKYDDRLKDHQKDVIRDFCDALIEAKEEAIQDEKETAPYLNDLNLSLVIMDLFFAGSDTTQYMMRWIILLMANNTDMQIKMRDEIENVIGDRIALHEDKHNCHYVNAFIAETLRYRAVAPLAVPHTALCDTQIGDYHILKDSFVFSNLLVILNDENHWKKPEIFDPTRFLTANGEFTSKFNAFTPFGIGRRVCLGEKLALADLFLITVRLLKSTSEYLIVLPEGDGSANLEPNPNVLFLSTPIPYKILLHKK